MRRKLLLFALAMLTVCGLWSQDIISDQVAIINQVQTRFIASPHHEEPDALSTPRPHRSQRPVRSNPPLLNSPVTPCHPEPVEGLSGTPIAIVDTLATIDTLATPRPHRSQRPVRSYPPALISPRHPEPVEGLLGTPIATIDTFATPRPHRSQRPVRSYPSVLHPLVPPRHPEPLEGLSKGTPIAIVDTLATIDTFATPRAHRFWKPVRSFSPTDTLQPVCFPFWMVKRIALDLEVKQHLEQLVSLDSAALSGYKKLVSNLENQNRHRQLQLELRERQSEMHQLQLQAKQQRAPPQNFLTWTLRLLAALGTGFILGSIAN